MNNGIPELRGYPTDAEMRRLAQRRRANRRVRRFLRLGRPHLWLLPTAERTAQTCTTC